MARRLKSTIALFVALAAMISPLQGCGGSDSTPTPPSVKHFVRYDGPGWKGVLVVNGIPVELMLSPQGAVAITEWTQTGVNEVTVVVEGDETVQGPFQYQIWSGANADGSDMKPLASPVAVPMPTVGNTTTASTTFQAPPRDPWLWERAVPPDITEQDQKEISDVFKRFCLAFANKNVDEVLDVFSAGSAIKAQAIGINMEQARKNDRELLQRIFANAGNTYVINQDDAQIRPFGRGVIIFPKVLDGSMHLLFIENKADPTQSPVFDFLTLCKIDGKWVRVN